MSKVRASPILNRLLGKKVVLSGKFAYGERERLTQLAEAQQGEVLDEVNPSVDFLVLADAAAGKTIQKKVMSLNARGATIQVLDTAVFKTQVEPTKDDLLALIRSGPQGAAVLIKVIADRGYGHTTVAAMFAGESFDGLDLSGFIFGNMGFEGCSFVGATLTNTRFSTALHCDFSRCAGESASIEVARGSRFIDAKLHKADIAEIGDADFTGADLTQATLQGANMWGGGSRAKPVTGCVFTNATLQKAEFQGVTLKAPNFDGADLSGAAFPQSTMESASMRNAKLRGSTLVHCKLTNADLTGADLRGANLGNADLTGACLDKADLAGCNLRGATLDRVDLKKAKNYTPAAAGGGAIGPALRELDKIAAKARRIQFSVRIRQGADGDGESVGVDTSGLTYGWGVTMPQFIGGPGYLRHTGAKTISDAMMEIANAAGHWNVRFETVDIQTTKSPTAGKELRDLVLTGISEAFGQPVPADDLLAAATKASRQEQREATAVDRQRREEARKAAEQAKAKATKQIAKKIEKHVGKVTDIATFLKALELRIEKPKIDKATKMLKASGFQLFNDVTETHLNGVVKSQTDPDLVYACRIESDGMYACCTQNLNVCGGLRGSICKHLLVLIIGLVKAGELDPTTIDAWIAKTHGVKPELNKETMGEIFIRYKGAEAGEVDWRPTQTVPEDYYAV